MDVGSSGQEVLVFVHVYPFGVTSGVATVSVTPGLIVTTSHRDKKKSRRSQRHSAAAGFLKGDSARQDSRVSSGEKVQWPR